MSPEGEVLYVMFYSHPSDLLNLKADLPSKEHLNQREMCQAFLIA